MEVMDRHYPVWNRFMKDRFGQPGDIAEFGVWNGNSTKVLAHFGRKVWAFDTFKGMPAEEFSAEMGDHDLPGSFVPDQSIPRTFEGYPNVIPVPGRFTHTLQLFPRMQLIAAHLDCDLYWSYRQVLTWLPDKLLPGALITVDDYVACAGARRAVDEWCSVRGLTYDPQTCSIQWPS